MGLELICFFRSFFQRDDKNAVFVRNAEDNTHIPLSDSE